MREALVEASFDIARRGVAAVSQGSAEGLPLGRLLQVHITGPDGVMRDATKVDPVGSMIVSTLPPTAGTTEPRNVTG